MYDIHAIETKLWMLFSILIVILITINMFRHTIDAPGLERMFFIGALPISLIFGISFYYFMQEINELTLALGTGSFMLLCIWFVYGLSILKHKN